MGNMFGGQRATFLLVFLTVTGVLVFASWSIIGFVSSVAGVDEVRGEDDALSPIYVDYYADVDEYISAESYLAMAAYQQAMLEPQNVLVLDGLSTQEVNGYMMNHVVAGMGVNCTYCHSLENFAADEWGDPLAESRKATARRHLQLTQDLNQNWLGNLDTLTDQKQPSGAQITCAVCHNGVAKPALWSTEIASLPDDFRLPLDESLSGEEVDFLNVNARRDISLDHVQYQQNVMYYMNYSMNVGCTHCHNSRYFPSREVPAVHYAQNMLQMTQYIDAEYGDSLNGQQPSCLMCHQERVIPPGAARSVFVMPPPLVERVETVLND